MTTSWKIKLPILTKLLISQKYIPIKTLTRSTLIVPLLINRTVLIHSGKKFNSILITQAMLNHKLGEFVPTRSTFVYKKKNKTKSKKK